MKRASFLCVCLSFLVACGGGGTEPAEEAGTAPADPGAEQAAQPAAGEAPQGTAVVQGVVNYEGEVPQLRPVSMSADPECQAKHDEPVMPEILELGEGNTLGNVFVRVVSGLPEHDWQAPGEPVVIDQQGCQYLPHVVGVMASQPLKFLNSDGLLHNVHALPETNQEFNMAMPAERREATQTFTRPEDPFRVKCDVHPWMNAWVAVMPHPFFATTDPDGRYELTGLPAGTYEVEVWHEKLGTQSQSVTVADGATAEADFTLSPPS